MHKETKKASVMRRLTHLVAAGVVLSVAACAGATTPPPGGSIGEVSTFDMRTADPQLVAQALERDGRVVLRGITFEFDSARLLPESLPAVATIGNAMLANPHLNVAVVGHTDNIGSFAVNKDVSERRAETIVAALRQNYGIAGNRLVALGVGPVAPIASNFDEAGRAMNRRVELVVID